MPPIADAESASSNPTVTASVVAASDIPTVKRAPSRILESMSRPR